MNIERLRLVQEWLRTLPDDEPNFNMMEYFLTNLYRTEHCGTTCCIAGYTAWKWGPQEVFRNNGRTGTKKVATELLDLTPQSAKPSSI